MNRTMDIWRFVAGFHLYSFGIGLYWSPKKSDPHMCIQIGPFYLIYNFKQKQKGH